MSKSHITKDNICRGCGNNLNGATGLEDERSPEPGDISICMYCATISMYNKDMEFTIMTAAEREELKGKEPEMYDMLIKASAAIQEEIKRSNDLPGSPEHTGVVTNSDEWKEIKEVFEQAIEERKLELGITGEVIIVDEGYRIVAVEVENQRAILEMVVRTNINEKD